MANLRSIKWITIRLSFLHYALVASTVCNSDIYGTPSKSDCFAALNQIPYAYPPQPDPVSQWPRIFAEPQYMSPPFGQIDNPYRPSAIVQLPKIYTSNSCRIAIMSQGQPLQQGVAASQFTTTWKNIVSQSQQFRRCFASGASGEAKGGYVPLNLPSGPGAAMYMYTSDSLWNTVAMNIYMSSGIAAVPYTHPNQLSLPHNTSSPNQPSLPHNTSSTNPLDLLRNASLATSIPAVSVSLKPLAPGEVVIQD